MMFEAGQVGEMQLRPHSAGAELIRQNATLDRSSLVLTQQQMVDAYTVLSEVLRELGVIK